MRIQTLAIPALAIAALGCASRSASVATTSLLAQCPNNVVATVTNPRNGTYDVYYLDRTRPATIIGEVSPGSTVTLSIPGEGLGRVYLRAPISAGGGMPRSSGSGSSPQIRIRVHCSGT